MTEDALILLLSVATRIACMQMTRPHLDALHASVEQASCLSARHDWERKAAAHAGLFSMGDRAPSQGPALYGAPGLRNQSRQDHPG